MLYKTDNFQIQDFLKFVNQIYTSLPGHLNKIFEPRSQKKVKDIAEINVDALLQEVYTVTTIMTDKKNADNQSVSVSFMPNDKSICLLWFNICLITSKLLFPSERHFLLKTTFFFTNQ